MACSTLRGLIAVFAQIAAVTSVTAQDLSTNERERLSPTQVERTVRRDLESIFRYPRRFERGNYIRFRDAVVHGRPVGTGIAGLCQRDDLIILYAPDGPDEPRLGEGRHMSAEAPVRAYGFQSERRYFFVRPPAEPDPDEDERRPYRSIFAEDCAAGTRDNYSGWFSAPGPHDAVEGYRALRAAAIAAATGDLPIEACPPDQRQACLATLREAAADPHNLFSIDRCSPADGRACWRAHVMGQEITVTLRRGFYMVLPGAVESVKVEQLIVVS